MTSILHNPDIDLFLRQEDYANAAKTLLEHQKKTWPQCRDGYDSLSSALVKEIPFDNFTVKVQFNPARIHSTSARVDAASISERKCFLCPENLPAEQEGILYGSSLIILCNPFPIFPEHFTVSSVKHTPQRILNSFREFLSLSRSLGKYYIVFYNGPACGASAPDHLHFQAGSRFVLPVVENFSQVKKHCGKAINEEITAVNDGLRRYFSVESSNPELISEQFLLIYNGLMELFPSAEEPMLNIISSYDENTGWNVLIFPRSKHRPSHYYRQNEDGLMVSPAAADIGGLIITPVEKDFNRIDAVVIKEIFSEVMLTPGAFEEVCASLSR